MLINLKTRSRNTQCISRATFIFLSIISHVFRFNVVVEIASSVLSYLYYTLVVEVVNLYFLGLSKSLKLLTCITMIFVDSEFHLWNEVYV